jgi:glycosyltransferase involved in cell wall biosynthesis
MKNLDFLIKVLNLIDKKYKINLNIYGSIDDQKYWIYCLSLLKNLPNNIKAIYHGEVKPELVRFKFDQNDVFVLPTRGENFGHVILESLSTYTPIILSDNTPWIDAESQAIQIISLYEKFLWKNKIEEFASLDNKEIEKVILKTKLYYNNFVITNNSLISHMDLFGI